MGEIEISMQDNDELEIIKPQPYQVQHQRRSFQLIDELQDLQGL